MRKILLSENVLQLFVYTAFWFQLYCGFSGQVMIDEVYLMFYNMLFTSVPPLLFGMFEQDACDGLLVKQPRLYAHGRLGLGYRWFAGLKALLTSALNRHSFWIEQADALWQSIAIYFTTYFTYYDATEDLWSFGYLIMTALVVLNQFIMAVDVQSWTMPIIISLVGSVVVYFAFALVYHAIVTPMFGVKVRS